METTQTTGASTPVFQDFALQEVIGDPTAGELDKDAFLQLLVAQLKYQDPLDPSDPAEFMATTAQFTTIEKLDELTKQGENNAIVTGLSMASSLVGRRVDYIVDGDEGTKSSVVTSAQVVAGQVRLMTNDGPVDLATVIGIGEVDSTDSTTPSSPTINLNTTQESTS